MLRIYNFTSRACFMILYNGYKYMYTCNQLYIAIYIYINKACSCMYTYILVRMHVHISL